jgi:hypothetical protein
MSHVLAAALAAALCAAQPALAQQPQEWTCPPAAKVGLLPTSAGWIAQDTVMYPYQAPALRFESMEIGPHGPAAVCKYRVVGSGQISIWKFGRCEGGKGTWKAAGPKSVCESDAPGACSLICSPV